MAKGIKRSSEELETEVPEVKISPTKRYELWNVTVTYKVQLNANLDKETVVDEIKKKGSEPIMVTHIEPRHAEVLNSQVGNPENPNKQYYFLTEK
jgi:hypothetical protein